MIGILSITFPIFAAIGLGYGTVKGGLFRQSDMRVLGAYVINIALPALIFLSVSSRSLSEVLNPAYLLVYLLGSLATLALAYLWFTLQGVGPARRAICAMGSACSNSGYVGYPVMMMILPDIAGLVLAMSVVVENVVIVPLCLVLLDLSRDRQSKSVPKLLVALLLGLLKRPIVIALLLAITTVASGIPLPVRLLVCRSKGIARWPLKLRQASCCCIPPSCSVPFCLFRCWGFPCCHKNCNTRSF
jgi:malonate transporter and related proteins